MKNIFTCFSGCGELFFFPARFDRLKGSWAHFQNFAGSRFSVAKVDMSR
jgi:hypothetical protein